MAGSNFRSRAGLAVIGRERGLLSDDSDSMGRQSTDAPGAITAWVLLAQKFRLSPADRLMSTNIVRVLVRSGVIRR